MSPRRATLVGAFGAGVLATALSAHAMPSGEAGKAVRKAHAAVRQMRLEDAKRHLHTVRSDYPDDPDVLYLEALLHFHRSEYEPALEAIESSLQQAPARNSDDRRKELRNILQGTVEVTEGFVTQRSDDGRFVVRHAPGRDEVLVPYVLDAMEAADQALSEDLGMRVPGPIVLEIYPSTQELAKVSTLSVEAIRRTGTIALCKWDRLMITSPRALVRGYPWVDTLGHEYVHLVLTRASNDNAPVWFQEGVAKFLERRWRGEPPKARIDPAADALLRKAVHEDELIPFEKLHPSIALLPSQRDAALAFAQVATFFESYYAKHGSSALREAVRRVAEGADARKALASAAGVGWSKLEQSWQKKLRSRPPPKDPPRLLRMRFRKAKGEGDDVDVEAKRAQRFVRLGDLLWDRGRSTAAKVEYGKAHKAAPEDPIVSSRLARAALASGDAKRSIEAIGSVVERHPDHAPARAVMSAARLAQGEVRKARQAAREAIRLNPFNPRPHCVLASAGADESERGREQGICERLGGTPKTR